MDEVYGNVNPTEPITGSFTFDSTASDGAPADVFSSDALPPAPPALSNFGRMDFRLSAIVASGQVQYDGIVETFDSGAAVPEPSSPLLVGVGAWICSLRRRRKAA